VANADDPSQGRCAPCAAGQFSLATNAPSCEACPNGQHSTDTTAGILCTPCAPGQYGNAKVTEVPLSSESFTAYTAPQGNAAHCHPCPLDHFQALQGKSECTKCAANRACPEGSASQSVCTGNEFVERETQKCRTCPRTSPDKEAECHDGALVMRDGFFSDATLQSGAAAQGNGTSVNGNTVFAKCPCAECCAVNNYTGATQCRFGTAGTLCAVCQKNPRFHRQPQGPCVACPDGGLAGLLARQVVLLVLIGMFLVLTLVDAWFWKWRHYKWLQNRLQRVWHRAVSKTKVLINFLQLVLLFGPVYDIAWPPQFKAFLLELSSFSFDLISSLQLDCYYDFDFHDGLLVSTLGYMSLAMFATLASVLKGRAENSSNRAMVLIRRWADLVVGAVLAIAFAAYPVLSAKIFATFNCGDVKHANGNTRFLRDDYSINCEDATHKAMESYAKAMVVIISIGTPVLYFVLLWRSRHAKHGGGGARHLLFLSQVGHCPTIALYL